MAYGKIIELFLVNGTADSLVTAELFNWNGKALKIPRIEILLANVKILHKQEYIFYFVGKMTDKNRFILEKQKMSEID